MKLTKKIIAVVMALMMTLSIGALTANAATVHLKTAQKSATSSTVYGYNKVFWGNTEVQHFTTENSPLVHFIAKYKMGGVWYTDKSKSIKKGKSCPSTNTSALSVERDWHLKLNPDGGGKYGCEAWGYINNFRILSLGSISFWW